MQQLPVSALQDERLAVQNCHVADGLHIVNMTCLNGKVACATNAMGQKEGRLPGPFGVGGRGGGGSASNLKLADVQLHFG